MLYEHQSNNNTKSKLMQAGYKARTPLCLNADNSLSKLSVCFKPHKEI